MEEKIYELYCEIKNENRKFVEAMDILGENSDYVKHLASKLSGMRTAFEIIAGETYIDYMCKQYQAA